MTITDDVYLPSDEEINHKSIPLTHNYFLSHAMWLGKFCDNQCKEFMLCRAEEQDPRKCLKEGQDVTECGLQFFRKVKQTCRDEAEWYTKCLIFSGHDVEYKLCRPEQALFDNCMYDNGFERAKFGHFNMLRVHETERPRPKRIVPIFPDSSPSFDIFDEKNRQKGPHGAGGRHHYQSV